MTLRGFDTVAASALPNNDLGQAPSGGGAESGALSRNPLTDPQLGAVVAAWSTLSEPIRRAILALIQAPRG